MSLYRELGGFGELLDEAKSGSPEAKLHAARHFMLEAYNAQLKLEKLLEKPHILSGEQVSFVHQTRAAMINFMGTNVDAIMQVLNPDDDETKKAILDQKEVFISLISGSDPDDLLNEYLKQNPEFTQLIGGKPPWLPE